MNYHRCTVYTTFFFMFSFFIFVFSRFYFSSFWTSCGLRCRPFSPPGTCLQFLSRIGFSVPTARRLSSNVANSRFRAFRESICAQEKVPTNLYEYEYALGGTRTHEIDLYSRHEDNLPRHRGDLLEQTLTLKAKSGSINQCANQKIQSTNEQIRSNQPGT